MTDDEAREALDAAMVYLAAVRCPADIYKAIDHALHAIADRASLVYALDSDRCDKGNDLFVARNAARRHMRGKE
jgi:hypothetical protein